MEMFLNRRECGIELKDPRSVDTLMKWSPVLFLEKMWVSDPVAPE